MNELELRNLWKTTNEQLEASLALNRENALDISKIKVKSLLGSMKPLKIFTLLVGILWVGIGGCIVLHLFVYAFDQVNLFFLFSAAIQIGLTAIALVVYLYQLVTLYLVDITHPILKTQKRLANLKLSTLWVNRILFLQLPVWTTFYWTSSMFEYGNWLTWAIQGTITLSFLFLAVWLFLNTKYENKDKKWFKLLFDGKEWTPLMNAMEMLEDVEGYEEL